MSGHSKWSNIKHKKEKTDAQKAKIFTKIGKEMTIAVKAGGGDPSTNSRLRDLIAKAKANNVPNDNIERTIKKAMGAADVEYIEITYEGYGPGGVAVIVNTATDNRTRTAANVRHYFSKYGGNLGSTGCVSFLFTSTGVILVSADEVSDEDALMELALDAGASDFEASEGYFEITTDPADLGAVRDAPEGAGYKLESAEIDRVPSNYVTITSEEDIKNMNLLIEHMEEDDDVSEVFHNWEIED